MLANNLIVSITQNCTDQLQAMFIQYVLLSAKNYKIQLKFHKVRPYINLALSKWKCADFGGPPCRGDIIGDVKASGYGFILDEFS